MSGVCADSAFPQPRQPCDRDGGGQQKARDNCRCERLQQPNESDSAAEARNRERQLLLHEAQVQPATRTRR